jgi:prepilin-type N-terminal cleavage/methylation domain-containing protein
MMATSGSVVGEAGFPEAKPSGNASGESDQKYVYGGYMPGMPRAEKGFTLTEVMISVSILTIALLGLAGALSFGASSGQISADTTQATTIARRMIEYSIAQDIPFTVSSLLPTSSSGINDSTSPYQTEPLNAAPFDATSPLTFSSDDLGFYIRHIETVSSRAATELGPSYNWKDEVRQISATILWTRNGTQRHTTLTSFVRRRL